ncbi:HNH endonuclease [Ideonella sp. YS5]|uniref:HNH endonuclease n=1 Tax=Ideonella sp. YS5 TaxID=3453714 RepID=UPI003EE9CBDD
MFSDEQMRELRGVLRRPEHMGFFDWDVHSNRLKHGSLYVTRGSDWLLSIFRHKTAKGSNGAPGNDVELSMDVVKLLRGDRSKLAMAMEWLRSQQVALQNLPAAPRQSDEEKLNGDFCFRIGLLYSDALVFLDRLLHQCRPYAPNAWVIDVPAVQTTTPATGEAEPNDDGSRDRLPVAVLNKATPQHVWWAVQALLAGQAQHVFGESTDYDLITDDGQRLPPKVVFGIALARALEREVLPKHFTAGIGSPCFRLLNAAGYEIALKGQSGQRREEPNSGTSEVNEWNEGAKKLVSHLKRERGRGLATAKKAAFREEHDGKLFCQRCTKDPVVEYETEHAESCIEVHHATMQLSEMEEGHTTNLEELQCLCANCHRLVHRLLRLGLLDV